MNQGAEIWVAGFPGYYGGADTELDHLLDLLRANEVSVNLVPMFSADENMILGEEAFHNHLR
jgi:hypothetical protein